MWQALHTSDSGRLENLNQLTSFGKEILYTFVHHLLQGHNGQTLNQTMKTAKWLSNNPNVDVSERNVLRILSKYRNPEKIHPIDNISHLALPVNGLCTDSKLEKAKKCEEICDGAHTRKFMAQILNVSVTTLKRKLGKRQLKNEKIKNKTPNPSCYFSQFHGQNEKINDNGKFKENSKKSDEKDDFRNSLQESNKDVEKPNFCQNSLDESLTPWNKSESELISITENIKYEVIEENDCDSFYKTKSVRNNSRLRDPLTVVENTEDTEKYDDNFKNDCCSNEFSKVINCDLETYDYKDYELKHDHEKVLKSEVKEETNNCDKSNQNKLDQEVEYIYECEICDKKFPKQFLLNRHNKYCHEKPNQCDQCEKSFGDITKLRSHIDCIHGGHKKFNCEICYRKFKRKATLENHIKKHDNKQDYKHKCDTCEKSFGSVNEKECHIYIVHKGHKDQQCQTCKKTFCRNSRMIRHVKIVHEKVKMDQLCTICGKSYYRPDFLKQHIKRVHEGSKDHKGPKNQRLKKYLCNSCGRTFKQSSSLQRHEKRIHEMDENYARIMCEICGKSVSTEHYKDHKLAAHGVGRHKDHKCDTCGKSFVLRRVLQTHIKSVHEGQRNNKCEICGKSFYAVTDMQRHIDSVHLNKPSGLVWKRKKKLKNE